MGELFPGLIYRLVSPRVVFLIFVSGKVVITGAKKETDLANALTKLYPVLVEFKKVQVAAFPPTVATTTTTTTVAVATAPTTTTTNPSPQGQLKDDTPTQMEQV